MKFINGLWAKAAKAGFTGEWKSRITDAYLARARQLVPSVRAHILSEVGFTQQRNSGRKMAIVKKNSRAEAGTGGGHSKSSGTYDASRKIDYSKTSDEDLINDNVTYRS